jgi:poly(hydroxyalkanoate) depolymerase family esterase
MRRLSDTISRLAALHAQHGVRSNGAKVDRLSDLRDFGSNPGALQAHVYIPDQLPEVAPLVVVLHGCTQTAAGYDHCSGWSKLADQEGFALLFPEQQRDKTMPTSASTGLCPPARRNGGEALSIRQMVEALVVAHDLDRSRIFVTGLSAGGAMTSVMLATYPQVFAGGAIIAGIPYGSATTVAEAFDRMRGHGDPSERELQQLLGAALPHKGPWPTISVWHGSADGTVAASKAKAIVAQWRDVHRFDARPARSEIVDGDTRRVWSDAEGRALIEEYSIAGMGHGAPLATAGEVGLGTGGPFMLDIGISSMRRIAHFWGIASLGGQAGCRIPRRVRHASPISMIFRMRRPREPLIRTRPCASSR